MRSLLNTFHARRNLDLRWLRENLAPRMISDMGIADAGITGQNGGHRVFLFENRDIEFKAKWLNSRDWLVVLQERNPTDVRFGFRVRRDKPVGGPAFELHADVNDPAAAIDASAARLRRFGEAYLRAPISRFNYATPGEYVDWPDRGYVEPARCADVKRIEEIDDLISSAARLLQPWKRNSTESRTAIEAEIRELQELRHREVARTTYGRWVIRHHAESQSDFAPFAHRLMAALEREAPEAASPNDDPSPL